MSKKINFTMFVVGAAVGSIATWQYVVKKYEQIAQEASGNAQGILYLKLSAHATALSRFILSGFGYSRRLLEARSAQQKANHSTATLDKRDSDICGILQLGFNDKEQKRLNALAAYFPESLLRPVNAQQASKLAGVTLEDGGLFYPETG